ncbi:MAG: GPR endopeptidase [Syntrophomonadaceae bacterium]|jgi:spore protease|nr:GPR endopeptidase [Syntrophomonadaceae bacterium]
MLTVNNFIKEFNLNVDLAVEASDLLRGGKNIEIDGIEEKVETSKRLRVNTITVTTPEAGARIGKPPGNYITIQAPPLHVNDPELQEEIINMLSKTLQKITLPFLKPNDPVLLVGLGNRYAAADSLGPKFIEYSPITRHYHRYAPEALIQGMRPASGIAPGVLGTTGLETLEIIKGVAEQTKPALVIAVDALAAQQIERIGSSIQISDTGIQPGAGIGNARHPLNQRTLGVPVIAIGCPTIVSAAVISNQSIQKFCSNSACAYDEAAATESIKKVLSYFGGSLSVTPKEIDEIIKNTAKILAGGVAAALFPGIKQRQLELYAM